MREDGLPDIRFSPTRHITAYLSTDTPEGILALHLEATSSSKTTNMKFIYNKN